MAVSLYFGLPGAGKTTLLTSFALKFVRSKRYKNVYHNVKELCVPGAIYVDNECFGQYAIVDGAVLIDEALLFAPNRNWKQFEKLILEFFIMHRHDNIDIYLFSQRADGCDKNIRVITDRVYYLYKPFILGKWFTKYYRIPYGIIIPDGKKHSDGQNLGEILQGYCKPSLLVRIFSPTIFRPLYYRFFDSWARIERPPLPSYRYYPYEKPKKQKRKLFNKK